MKRIFFLFFVASLFTLHSSRPSHALHTYLRIHIESEPRTLDPAQATGIREFQILQAIFEGLTRYDPQTLRPLPGVAERWEISSDGKTYRFFLRDNAKWSDGKPITAQDFFNAWEHLLNPKTNSPYAFQLFYLKGGKEYAGGKLKDRKKLGMVVLQPNLFEVTLEKPTPYFLYLTSFSALAPRRKEAPKVEQITNGPFQLANEEKMEGILLLPNKHYWGTSEVKLHGILFRPFGNFATALKYYDRTGIDIMVELPPEQVRLLKFRSDFRSGPLLRTDYFLFQCQKPPFDNKEVRQAFSLAMDRKTITEKILNRGDIAYRFFVPPGMPGYKNPKEGQDFDPWKAQQFLSRAGYGPQKKFPLIVLHYASASDKRLVAKAAQEMWQKNLGVKIKLVEEEWDGFIKRRQAKDFNISWGGWSGDYPDPKTFLELFVSDNRQNHAGWSHPTYDALMREAEATLDLQKRAQLFQEAESLLLREAPIAVGFAKVKNYLIQPYVKGYYPNLLDIHPLRDVYSLRP